MVINPFLYKFQMQSGHFFVVITKIIYVFRNRAEIRYCRRQLTTPTDDNAVRNGFRQAKCISYFLTVPKSLT